MAKGKELVPYNRKEAITNQIKGIGKKIVKKVPKVNKQYKFLGKVAGKTAKLAYKATFANPFVGIGLSAAGAALGASSRRYNKAPRFGETGRDLSSRLIKRGI